MGDAARSRLRVVVVDDHTFYRDGLVGLLEDSGLEVVADVSNGEAALGVVPELQPDAVVMDLSMPGLGGIESTRRLATLSPATPVVLLTVSQEEEDVLGGLLAGARGFVLKDGPVEEVVKAVEEVAAGRAFLSARVSQRLLEHVHQERGKRVDRFTASELEVLRRLSTGETLREIAVAMGMSSRAVHHLASEIVLKLQAESRGDIAVSALRDRIV